MIDLNGETLAAIQAPLNFHYRLAPDGATFVGIDAGGEHTQVDAERFVYHIYDASGEAITDITSERPHPVDSAYTSDGAAFVINSAAGLSAYRIDDGEPLWQVTEPTRLFAAGPADSALAVASSEDRRTTVGAFRNGEPLWRFELPSNVRGVTVSPNGAYIVAVDKTTAHIFSPQSGEPLWSFQLPDEAFTINSVAVNDDGFVALGAQHESLSNGLAFMLDGEGRVRFERGLRHERSNAWIPTVQFDAAGDSVLIRTLEEMLLVAAN